MITFLGRHITDTINLGPFLSNVYGLGPRSSFKLCNFFGLGYNDRVSMVDSEKLFFIQQFLSSYVLESNLKRQVNDNIQNKLKIQSYSGLRLSQGLPSRGQRTKTNSQTCKKFRKKNILLKLIMLTTYDNMTRSRKKTKPFKFYTYRSRVKKKPFDFRVANRRYIKAFLLSSLVKKGFRSNHVFFKSSLYSVNPRFFKNFSYRIRVPFYAKDKHKLAVGDFSKKRKRLVYSLLPLFGLNLRSSVIRNKYFYKRRSVYNFFKHNFFNISSGKYKSDTSFFSSVKFYLHMRQTKNNLFFFLKTNSGRLVFNYTNGQTIYKGSRRTTPTAAELAGKQISKFLLSNKISTVCLVFESPITSMVKSAVRGLSNQLSFSSIIARNFVAHNGLKLKSTRRV